jgi:hypothetical protein
MNPTVRLLIALALIAFLVVFGLLAALQELRSSNIVDPVISAEMGEIILPLDPIGGAKAYQSQDYRARAQMASAYYRTGEGDTDDVLLILSSMAPENLRADGDLDQGLAREWDEGDFEQLGSGFTLQSFQIRGTTIQGQAKVFTDGDKQQNQFVLSFPWSDRLVWVQVNGPAEIVTVANVQAMLDSVRGEPQPLKMPEPPQPVAEPGTTAPTGSQPAGAGQ